ncbi:hypothetical protein C8T65DRAFT_692843 [Cerioporus squamosus]|nr:hypothetical protein C8T65DRAFT_692843 [Cerioporus squamosus]
MDDSGSQKEKLVEVYARWVGYANGCNGAPELKEKSTHIYSAAIPPEEPLALGMRVRILATTPAWYLTPEEGPDTYDTYDAHIVGTITGVAGWRGRKVILEVKNECAMNTVVYAKLRIPYAPDVTVQLGSEEIPVGRAEAQEADLNTSAVVRPPPEDARCSANTCCAPWRRLVGDGFLWEPMAEEVGERPGARGGRKKLRFLLASWEELAEAEAETRLLSKC